VRESKRSEPSTPWLSSFHEPVLRLFDQAMILKIPHNVFGAWMVSPLPAELGSRPLNMLHSMALLQSSLVDFGDKYRPVEKNR
jgi:hypothetical protein